jgi:hypothetical protein
VGVFEKRSGLIFMEKLLFVALICVWLVYVLLNHALLKVNSESRRKLERQTYWGILILVVSVVTICFATNEIVISGSHYLAFVALIANVQLIVFPFTNLMDKASASVRNLLSGLFQVCYGLALAFGLISLFSTADTLGNTNLLWGIVLTMWAFPNFFMAVLMGQSFLFAGILKIVLGLFSLVAILITYTNSPFDGNVESIYRMLSFLISAYLVYEGVRFVAKKRPANTI